VRAMEPPDAAAGVPFGEAVRFWMRLGLVNFGGPTGQIALMHSELVERRGWIGEPNFLHALNFAMLLPGPEAHQLAIYVGWLLNGSAGAIVAGVFFLLPAFFLIVALSWIYAVHGDVAWIAGVFDGFAWAVVAIVAAAMLRIAARSLGRPALVLIAVLAFLALYLVGVPFPLVVIGAGVVGAVARDLVPSPTGATASEHPERVRPTLGRTVRVLILGLAIWLVPLLAIAAAAGFDGVLAEEALFFSIVSLVTFGGAYAVLAYVNQAAVLRFGWLTADEMAVGLSLAETTPGPLILVVCFVGFLGAFREPGALAPAAAGVLGAAVAAWATFVPSFLWIFLGAPSVERLRGNERLGSALAAITAAVVGVIGSLALTFATNVLFDDVRVRTPLGHDVPVPVWSSVDLLAVAVALAAFVALRRFDLSVIWVILAAGIVGLVRAVA
jgi:chromate transporter